MDVTLTIELGEETIDLLWAAMGWGGFFAAGSLVAYMMRGRCK